MLVDSSGRRNHRQSDSYAVLDPGTAAAAGLELQQLQLNADAALELSEPLRASSSVQYALE
jgi:hypothetical protein